MSWGLPGGSLAHFQNCPVFPCSPSFFSIFFPVFSLKKNCGGLVVTAFPKTDSSSLIPYDIFPLFPYSPKPLGDLYVMGRCFGSVSGRSCFCGGSQFGEDFEYFYIFIILIFLSSDRQRYYRSSCSVCCQYCRMRARRARKTTDKIVTIAQRSL